MELLHSQFKWIHGKNARNKGARRNECGSYGINVVEVIPIYFMELIAMELNQHQEVMKKSNIHI